MLDSWRMYSTTSVATGSRSRCRLIVGVLAPMLLVLGLSLLPRAVLANGGVATCDESHLDAALASGGLITFACGPATIVLSSQKVILSDTSIDGGGVITISGGGNATRLFSVTSGVRLELNNLTLRDTNVYTFLMNTQGGAVFNNGTLSLNTTTFVSNTAGEGGAIANFGTLTVAASAFINNRALYGVGIGGGAILNRQTMTVTASSFVNNSSWRDGGALSDYGQGYVGRSTFSGNSAANGGAISHWAGTLTIERSTFVNNQANSLGITGGAIFNVATLTIRQSALISNTANGDGGAIYQFGSSPLTIGIRCQPVPTDVL